MKTSKDKHQDLQVTVNGTQLEQVKEFVYLGGQIAQDGRSEPDIKRSLGLTWAVFNKLINNWNCRNLGTKGIKILVYETMVIPVLMYGSECWTMRKEDERKILVTEMCWLRRLMGISRLQHIRNDDIRARTGMQVTIAFSSRRRGRTGLKKKKTAQLTLGRVGAAREPGRKKKCERAGPTSRRAVPGRAVKRTHVNGPCLRVYGPGHAGPQNFALYSALVVTGG